MAFRRTLLAAAALACAALAWLASHALLGALAVRVERRTDAVLWGDFDEHRQLLVPENYVGRGARRVLLSGPSECREAFLPERIEAALPSLSAYQNSFSLGMLSDVRLLLDYLERGYGKSALPCALVLGLTPRFVANLGAPTSPLVDAIERYSPLFRVANTPDGPRLERRGWWAGWAARASFLTKQSLRYRNAVRVALRVASRDGWSSLLGPLPQHPLRPGPPFAPARYQRKVPWSPERAVARMTQERSVFLETAQHDYAAGSIARDLQTLRDVSARLGVTLVFVLMPERSEHRALYGPGVYEAYLAEVRRGLGDAAVLDLRTDLDDADFYDASHPSRTGAERVSQRLAHLLAELPDPCAGR